MPLYTVMTQAGALSGEAKAKLAGELTRFHSEYAGVPKNWVHIVFQDYAPGSGFTAGENSLAALREKIPALSLPPLPTEMLANRAHLCAWLSVSFGRERKNAAKYRIDSVACRCS
jgi:phenylpyruvate tautomerase PptA (4-oxalocrotonate tautomerase family)